MVKLSSLYLDSFKFAIFRKAFLTYSENFLYQNALRYPATKPRLPIFVGIVHSLLISHIGVFSVQ